MRCRKLSVIAFTLGLQLVAGCMSMQPSAFPVGTIRRAPKPANAPVTLFKNTKPTRHYAPVAKLNVHLEKTFFLPSIFSEALPELEKLARQNGADAIVEVVESKSRLNETFIYNVTATAVVFTE